ncbi:MAG: CoA pyrophosphatase [Sphingomonadaceae bacterium]
MPSLTEQLRACLRAPAPAHIHAGDITVGVPTHLESGPTIPAAVLIPIVRRPDPAVLLTTRTAHLRNHAGQVAFPGGRIDPTDADAAAAALREAEEEIGLATSDVEIIGQTDSYRTGTGFRIAPVVGLIPPDLPLVPSPHEVANIFEVPMDFLLDPANYRLREMMWQGRKRHYYEMDFDGHHIWGATAGMLVNLAHRLA